MATCVCLLPWAPDDGVPHTLLGVRRGGTDQLARTGDDIAVFVFTSHLLWPPACKYTCRCVCLARARQTGRILLRFLLRRCLASTRSSLRLLRRCLPCNIARRVQPSPFPVVCAHVFSRRNVLIEMGVLFRWGASLACCVSPPPPDDHVQLVVVVVS